MASGNINKVKIVRLAQANYPGLGSLDGSSLRLRRKLRTSVSPLRFRLPATSFKLMALAAFTVCAIAVWRGELSRRAILLTPMARHSVANEIDEALQRAAAAALGQQEGVIIVVDPQTGRVRAIVNEKLASENAYSPGSTIKPFTALAALRAGLIDKNSTTLCRQRFASKDFHTTCSHPVDLPPLDPAEAIAYSCNYYFGTLGERLDEATLSETLSSFGFGKSPLADEDRNHAGQLLRGKVDPRNALGEGDHLQATPMQLLMAYVALVNGGHLLTARVLPSSKFQPAERASLEITPEQRRLIIAGMRGAVVYGTAARAGLNSASLTIFGKTGTSTPLKGFRTQGWFMGFAAPASGESEPTPKEVRLGVLVFLKRGHGSNAAAVARTVFAEYSRVAEEEAAVETANSRGGASSPTSLVPVNEPPPANSPASSLLPISPSASSSALPSSVRVHQVTENITKEISLEDYVLGVVATESSMEEQPEALKALAVAARTYAVKNAGRHARDGYDFCTTTHCQRFTDIDNQAQLRPAIFTAVRTTAGEVMRDQNGQVVDSYFSASCGGMSANLQTLWGAKPPAYLRGVPDEFCAGRPHHNWTDVIPSARLLLALQSDARTDPGSGLRNLVITRHDSTGRAELITIEGERRHTINGWDFKIIVGRKLGWNHLKSSRFEISRAGANYIFRGSGFGHGLGLCQEGSHVMAQRGVNYRQILAKYFPGTSVTHAGQQSGFNADLIWHSIPPVNSARTEQAGKRTSLSSEHFRINFPVSLPQREAEGILKTLEASRAGLLQKISRAGVAMGQLPPLQVFINATTGDFTGRTGQPWWAAAATKGNLIELQPVAVLKRRGVLESTIRHELVHTMIDQLSHGRAPRWLAEGTALYFAGEGETVAKFAPRRTMGSAEIDNGLARAASADEMRAAYAAAYGEVLRLIKADGESSLWRRLAGN